MFVINTEIEVNWILPATVSNYQNTDFDVCIKKPDGSSIYLEGAILDYDAPIEEVTVEIRVDENPIVDTGSPIKVEDFIAPTDITLGAATYRLNPDMVGVWVVILTMGNSEYSNIFYEYFLRVSEPDTHIYQQVTV